MFFWISDIFKFLNYMQIRRGKKLYFLLFYFLFNYANVVSLNESNTKLLY